MSQVSFKPLPDNPQFTQQRQHRFTRMIFLVAALVSLALLASCANGMQLQLPGNVSPSITYSGAVESALNYSVPPTPTPVPVSDALQVVVNTGGSRANIRSGPGLNAAIIAKGEPGTAFKVVGKSDDGGWWQICCVQGPNDTADNPTRQGWVSNSVVRLLGEGEAVGVTEPVLKDDLTSQWQVDWSCQSDRCTIKECSANVTAAVTRRSNQQFIPVEHQVEWADQCFNTDSWVFEVDPFVGKERTGEFEDNFLYAYWKGANPGEISGVYRYTDTVGIVVNCSGPETVEIEEGDGWTSVYEGVTCHDRKTGMLVYMNYLKRWLFTGEYEGQTFERAFFGDTEQLEQKLTNTNLDLFFVDRVR
jgi:hypothetical protein